MLEAGMVLARRYEIQKKLSEGGNASVYLAYDKEDRRNRAVKEVNKSADERLQAMAQAEAELLQRINYPYFPEIFEILKDSKADYIVMEYLEGETLADRLKRLGAQPQQQVVKWGKDLCLMLDYLHRCEPPVIYRDMKPENVMVQSAENLRLVDFGTILELRADTAGQELLLGTRGYAAPEQFDGKRSVDARTDIYGLGVTMYQLLTGKDPCEYPCGKYSIRDWNRSLSRKLDKIIKKCTREDPAERYQSCDKLWKALSSCETG